jgi:hypothetical protein
MKNKSTGGGTEKSPVFESSAVLESQLKVGLRLRHRSDGSGGSGMSLFGGAEHQRLIDSAKSLYFVFCLLESCLELLGGHLEVLDVSGCAVKEGDLARLLVGNRKGILEAAVAIPEFITTPLLRFDALLSDGLAASIGGVRAAGEGLEVVILLIRVLIAGLPARSLGHRAGGGGGDGVEAM